MYLIVPQMGHSARFENLTHSLSNSGKKNPNGFAFLPYVVECERLWAYITAVPGSTVLKQKEETLTQPLLQQIMFVFNTCHFENSPLMEENQHYSLTKQHTSILISDEKLMVPMSSKHTPDFFLHLSCVLYYFSLHQLPLPARQGKWNKWNAL